MEFLNTKYPKYVEENKAWKNGLFNAVIILFIFLLFQPFGLKDKTIELKVALYPGYSLIAFFYMQINYLSVRLLPNSVKNWNIKNELIFFIPGIIFLTFIVHLFTSLITGDMPLNIWWYLKLLYQVASVFLVIRIIEFFYYNNKAANNRNKKLDSQYKIIKKKFNDSKKNIIHVLLENDQIEVDRNKIIYIQSDGNYLQFYLHEPNKEITRIVKRGRLHKVENSLAPFPEFFRSHRAFLINLKYVKSVSGNIKNAQVIFKYETEKIPVSRTHFKELKKRLEIIRLA